MEAAVKECIRDMLDHERRLRKMSAKRYIVRLTEHEQTELLSLITKGISLQREVAELEAERNAHQSTAH